MNSKTAIIHILGLLALVVPISSEVSARVFTETSSNTKKGNVEKINGVNKVSYVNGGFRGYPYNGGGYSSGYPGTSGGYVRSYYPGIGSGYPGNYGGYYPGNGGGYYGNGGYRGGYPMNGGSYLGNGGSLSNVGRYNGGVVPRIGVGVMGNIRSYIGGYINGYLSNGGQLGGKTQDNTHN